MRSPPIPLNVVGLATAPRLIRPDSVCALYVQIRWGEITKVNRALSNAADQNRQNILGSNRWLHSYCQLGRPCALRFLGELRRRDDLFRHGKKWTCSREKRSNQSGARSSWLSCHSGQRWPRPRSWSRPYGSGRSRPSLRMGQRPRTSLWLASPSPPSPSLVIIA